jgi:hypothetical protein
MGGVPDGLTRCIASSVVSVIMVIVAALTAAVLYGAGAAVQQRQAAAVPQSAAGRPRQLFLLDASRCGCRESPCRSAGSRRTWLRCGRGRFLHMADVGAHATLLGSRHERNEKHMIEAEGLTERYGRTVAVDEIDFQVKPGVVTG